MKSKSMILGLLIFFNLQAQADKPMIVGGDRISVAAINKMFSTIRTDGSLGVQIGPRAFLTCGHCTRSPHKITSPIPEKNCALELSRFNENDTLDSKAVLHCSDAGELDLALIVQPKPTLGKMVTLNFEPLARGDELIVIGGGRTNTSEPWTCGGYDGYRYTTKSIFDFIDGIIVFEGFDSNGRPSPYTCAGDSGAQYFKLLEDGRIELSGVHSWGFEKGGKFSLNKVGYVFPSLFGGTSIAHRETLDWLNRIINSENLEICGINLVCDPVIWNPNEDTLTKE